MKMIANELSVTSLIHVFNTNVNLVKFMYLVSGENYRRRLRSLLLCPCGVLRALENVLCL